MSQVANIIDIFLDRIGFRKFYLVDTYEISIYWKNKNYKEKITFFLLENKNHKRYYKVHEYGYCKIFKMHKKYLSRVQKWMYGMDLKNNPATTNVIKDNVIPFKR